MPENRVYLTPGPNGAHLEHHYDGTTWRALGCLPPKPGFGGLPKYSAAAPTLPRTSWFEVDYSAFNAPILDQGQHGSCVGHGSASAFWRTWLMKGGTPHDFSACYVYGNINGGRDSGAVVSDALTSMQQKGVALLSDVPEGMIYRSQFPASADTDAVRFKVGAAYHCQTFDDIVSALSGFMVVYGIYVGSDFGNLDSNGVAPAHPGRVGNHCMNGCGVRNIGGKWVIRDQNSWGTAWGLNGFCYLSESHFTGTDPDAFAIQVDLEDPQETNLPPRIS